MSPTAAKEELDGPQCDPLEFYRGLVRSLGITVHGRRAHIKKDSVRRYNGLFYHWRGSAPPTYSSIDVQLWYRQYQHGTQESPSLESFVGALDDRITGGPTRKDFRHLKHPLSVFGSFWKGLDIFFICNTINTDNTERLGDLIYRQVLKLQCFEDQFFLQKNETYIRRDSGLDAMYSDFPGFRPTNSVSRSPDWENNFDERHAPKKGMLEYDYRPFLHRTLEYLAGAPRERWHDPQEYLKNDTDSSKKLLDRTVNLLFQGDEQEQLRSQLAALELRRGFPSIPSLNLGLVMMPAPGTRDVVPDYLAQGGQLLVEALTPQLGHQDAAALVELKLLNYLLHKTGFQQSRERAQEVAALLSSQLGVGVA